MILVHFDMGDREGSGRGSGAGGHSEDGEVDGESGGGEGGGDSGLARKSAGGGGGGKVGHQVTELDAGEIIDVHGAVVQFLCFWT